MKVAVATVHDSANIGSVLQAIGMQELIKLHGDEPIILKTRSEFTSFCLFIGYNNSPDVRSLMGYLKHIKRILFNPGKFIKGCQRYSAYKRDRKILDNVCSVKKQNESPADVLLLGSDEIWNSNQPAFLNPYLYGHGINAEKKLGYAVSLGNMDIENFKKHPKLLSYIKELDFVLARDNRTKNILEENNVSVNDIICDPTLQVDIRKYMIKSNVNIPKDKYIAVYSYSVDNSMKKIICEFARKQGLKIVSVSLMLDWCDEYINCSPLEFGEILKNAEYVYTSTFHGTIFSALYHAKFISQCRMPKIKEVLGVLGLEYRGIDDACSLTRFENIIESEFDEEKFEARLKALRIKSFKLYEKFVKGKLDGDM